MRGDRLALLTVALLTAGCGPGERQAVPAPAPAPGIRFVEATAAAGLDFVHWNGASERRYLPETMGSGVAVVDYDGDGWVDLFFVNGAGFGAGAVVGPGGALYRNLGEGRFAVLPDAAGAGAAFPGMGAAVGDIDNDGDADLFVTAVGGDRLFVNGGDGAFREESGARGLAARGFGTSAAFLDADADGWLDLLAGRYVEWSPESDVPCSPDGVHASYCTPEVYPGEASRFYRNLGGGRFVDASARAGVLAAVGKTLGVVPLDHDRDGWPDIAVANDTERNFLFVNQRDGTFREIGLEAGMALSASGAARGGMGIDAGDLAGRGLTDLVIGNFAQEMAALYRAAPSGLFSDEAAESGIGIPSLMTLAFGTLIVDADLDGWLDVVLANGHIEPEIARFQPSQSYAQPLQLFRRLDWRFVEETGGGAEALRVPRVGRGLAELDFDRDGDPDLVLTQNGRQAVLLGNEAADAGASWLRLTLVGRRSNRDGYGARIEATVAGRRLTRTLVSGRSYLSASEAAVGFGLASAETVESVDILWPSGARQRLVAPPLDRHLRLVEPERAPA
jgi:hypothetical protein